MIRFPTVGEIATTSIISIDINASLQNAIDAMCNHGHRNVIIIAEDKFHILGVSDILDVKVNKNDLSIPIKELDLPTLPTMHKDDNILSTMEYLSCDIEHICVTDDNGKLYGLITRTDITSSIDPETLMNNFCLNDFLKLGKRVKWIKKETHTKEALDDMIKGQTDSVMIVEDKKPIGIFTTKDVIKVIRKNLDINKPISEYMSSPVDTINKASSVKNALDFLKQKHYKRVVVVDEEGNLTGMITQKELISLAYSKWAILMKEHQDKLDEINQTLINKNKQIEYFATRDPLTGLYNRYKFTKLFDVAFDGMQEDDYNISLIMLDIDHFKSINDNFGHNVGDDVLVAISNILTSTLREVDIVCRWGGEEFIILLTHVHLEDAINIAQKLRLKIEQYHIDTVKNVTASFGVTKVTPVDTLKSAVDRADTALYEAKEAGRNCVKSI